MQSFTKDVMKIPNYKDFKEGVEKLTATEKDLLFYWSLIDSSGWEEVPTYFPEVNKGYELVIQILNKIPKIEELIKKDKNLFLQSFIEAEFLTNFLLSIELENELNKEWVLDIASLHKTIAPDIIFNRSGKPKVGLEIKGLLSATNLMDRVKKEVKPLVKVNSYENFLLLLLFPICPKENPARINQLIEGYYVYEEFIGDGRKNRKVICQCFTDEEKSRGEIYSLNNLAKRIVNNYFRKLE